MEDEFLLKSTSAARIEDVDKMKGVVVAYWSSFGNKDSHGDTIVQGAYAETIKKRGPAGSKLIKFLWNHDYWTVLPPGLVTALEEDADGLKATVQMSRTSLGNDLLILYEDEVINQHSVGIDVQERDEEDLGLILKCKLWEGSAVIWGANPLTPTVSVKGATPMVVGRLTAQSRNIRKVLDRRPITDETGDMLTGALKVLEVQLAEFAKHVPPATSDPTDGDDEAVLTVEDVAWLNDQFDSLGDLMR